MRPLEVRKYLFDILEVERQFEIVGEALARALRLEPGLSAQISETARIIAFRNRLIHGYASVSSEVVWGVLEANLPGSSRPRRTP